jgi:hypothetical protein
MTGLVDFTLGLRYLMQTPNTARAKREAARLMAAGVQALNDAFPPNMHKGTGANGLHTVLAHLTQHDSYLLQMYGTACNVDDAVVEERHQPMKAQADHVNRGRRDTWPRTLQNGLCLLQAVRLAFQEGRFGPSMEHALGDAAVDFSTQASAVVAHLVWGRPSYSDAVEVVARSADDLSPRPRCAAPAMAACTPLLCWCCPAWMAAPALVVWRRATQLGDISFTFGVGGVPSEPHSTLASAVLPINRQLLLQRACIAAFPGVPAASWESLATWGALKLPGVMSPVRAGDWVLLDRAQLLAFLKVVEPSGAHDAVVAAAAQLLDPLIAVPDDYQFWPERYVVARVRDINAVEADGVRYTLITPIYYEFINTEEGQPRSSAAAAGENVLAWARDTSRSAACPVGTHSWIVTRWLGGPGSLQDETPLPTGIIRRVPNIVHFCAGACKPAEACAHGMYVHLAEPARTLLCRGCTCSAKQKSVRRIVHQCKDNDRWLISPFDLGNRSRVEW